MQKPYICWLAKPYHFPAAPTLVPESPLRFILPTPSILSPCCLYLSQLYPQYAVEICRLRLQPPFQGHWLKPSGAEREPESFVFLHFVLPQIHRSIAPTKARERKRENKHRLLMECVFGLVGDGFAIIASDTSAVHSILVHKSNEDKVMILDSHKLMGASGEPGDRVHFTEYIQKNVALYQFRNGIPLTTAAAANFTRGELATALRKNPYFVNIILAGHDKDTEPSLYFIDYIATLHKVDKAAFGYGSYFALSIMDRHYHRGMSLEDAINLVDKCIMEIRSRLVVAPPNFVIKIVDKNGAREYAWREFIKDAATGLPAA